MYLLSAFLLFAAFTLNVVLGAWGHGVYLSDVQEMLTLFAAVVCFVAAILKKEAAEQKTH